MSALRAPVEGSARFNESQTKKGKFRIRCLSAAGRTAPAQPTIPASAVVLPGAASAWLTVHEGRPVLRHRYPVITEHAQFPPTSEEAINTRRSRHGQRSPPGGLRIRPPLPCPFRHHALPHRFHRRNQGSIPYRTSLVAPDTRSFHSRSGTPGAFTSSRPAYNHRFPVASPCGAVWKRWRR